MDLLCLELCPEAFGFGIGEVVPFGPVINGVCDALVTFDMPPFPVQWGFGDQGLNIFKEVIVGLMGLESEP